MNTSSKTRIHSCGRTQELHSTGISTRLGPEEQTWIYDDRRVQELHCTRGASVSPQITEWNHSI